MQPLKVALIAIVAALGLFAQQDAAEDQVENTSSIREETWNGTLVDWDCKQADPEPPCPVSAGTKQIGLSIDGGVLVKLDEEGNQMALETLEKKSAWGNLGAVVRGVLEGRTLEARTFELKPKAGKF